MNRARWSSVVLFLVLSVAVAWACGLAAGVASPVVVDRAPGRGEELHLDGVLELVFDRAMDRSSVQEALSLVPAVAGTFSWPDERTIRFAPASGWPRDTAFLVTLGTLAADTEGVHLSGIYSYAFRTVGYLVVTQIIPAPGTENVAADASITVLFNRPVVPLLAVSDPAAARLPEPVSLVPATEGKGEWLNTSIYVFKPSRPLRGGTTYSVRVQAGLTDTTGGILLEDALSTFSTEVPGIAQVDPSAGEKLVPVDTKVQVRFNMPVAQESVRRAFTLRRAGVLYELLGLHIDGTLEIAGATATFTPSARLEFGTEYIVSVAPGVTSDAGGTGMPAGVESHFTTVPLPRIVGTNPQDGDSAASPYTSFSIEFNAPVLVESVVANLQIEPAVVQTQTSTYFHEWNNTFVISFDARPSTSYVVRIGPDIRDRYGNLVGQPMTVRFRTRPLDPAAWLALPDRTSTCDSSQDARVLVAHRNTDRLDLALYRLTLDDYFQAQADWYSYTPPSDGRVRRWSVNVEAKENELGYTTLDLVRGGGPLEPGIYWLDLDAEGLTHSPWAESRILVSSAVNLTQKTDEKETLVWATDLATGSPVAFLRLLAYDAQGHPIADVTTDGNGLARFPRGSSSGITVVGDSPFTLGDPFWSDGITAWEFGLESGYTEDWRAHIDTDRPIYRPGQVVHFRGIVRVEDDARYQLPEPGVISVTVHDSAWQIVFDGPVPLDTFGTFTGDLTLSAAASLGTYTIDATLPTATFYGAFQVAAYRPPEFEVTVAPADAQIARGEATRATALVQYFFGGPVKQAPVNWHVSSAEYVFQPPQLDRYRFTDSDDPWVCFDCWWRPAPTPELILSGTGETDDEGKLVMEIPATATAAASDPSATQTQSSRTLTVEATVRGADGETVSGRSSVILHRGDFYVGLAPKGYVGRAGDPMTVDLVTVDWEGVRLPQTSLEYLLFRREWVNTFVEEKTGGGHWEWSTNDVEVSRAALSTDVKGEASLTFTPPEGGSYRVVVRGRDSHERSVQSSVFVWVSGKEYVSWRRTNDDRIALVSDRSTYRPGETARILIPSPFAGEAWALVTVERGTILKQDVLLLASNSTVYELPISADYAPNVYVSVVLVEGRAQAQARGGPAVASHKVGYVSLAVQPVPQELHISLSPSSTQALPGQEEEVDLLTTDAAGKPVSASLELDVVDKAVLSLAPRTKNAIVEAFYGFRGLGVTTSSGLAVSVDRLLLEQLEVALAQADKELFGMGNVATAVPLAAAPSGLAEERAADGAVKSAAGQLPAGISVREEFADTAYWNAGVITGPDGKARVSFVLPDNLTTWVFRAVGTTAATQVGETTDEVLVTKPLLVRPVVPRFFVAGDRVELAALVNNNTGGALVTGVTLGSVGLSLESGATQTVSVRAAGEVKVTWWASVEDVPQVDLAMSAVSGGYSDAARPRLATGPEGTVPVFRYAAPEVVGTAGELATEGSRTEVIALPSRYDDRRGELSLELAPSLAAGMREGLDYLEHFEYECTEQVVSRFLPNVLTYRALVRLGIRNATLEEKLPGLVDEGLTKLYTRQHADGGWGWWSDGESNPNLTAYVVFALLKATETGYVVHADVVGRGLDFLEAQLVPASKIASTSIANRQAWLLYVLVEGGRGKGLDGSLQDLFSVRGKLAQYARAYLALALRLLDARDVRVPTLLSDLENAAILSATGAHWEESDYDFWAMNTDTRSTAIVLDALARLDPENGLIPNVVRWLMVARQDGIWETTQETAWALISLTDWMSVTGELNGSYDYAASLNGSPLWSGTVTPETVGDPVRTSVDVAELLPGVGNLLSVSRGPGPGRLYYTAHLKVYLPASELGALDRGISVSRQYVPVDRPLSENGPEVNTAAVGDVVQVRLTLVAPHDLYYVVVEDPLPAGGEAVDTTLATTSELVPEPGLTRGGANDPWSNWWWRWYTRSEMRDEKVVLFADYLPRGTYTYQYTFRATQPGAYQVIPTTASEFYFPEVFGRSDGRLFTVTEGR